MQSVDSGIGAACTLGFALFAVTLYHLGHLGHGIWANLILTIFTIDLWLKVEAGVTVGALLPPQIGIEENA